MLSFAMDHKETLLQFLDCLNASTTVEQLLQQSAEFVARAFRPMHCALWANGTNVSQIPASEPFLALSKALHAHVQATNAFVLVHNAGKDVLTSHIPLVEQLQVQLAAFPIRLQGKAVATLVFGSSMQFAQHAEFISSLLDKLSIALGRAQRYQDAQHSAMTDALTGLYNKAYFLEALKNEVARSQRSQRPISLVLFDFDNFKEYNDTHGHVEGDRLLQRLGELVRSSVRAIDIPARYGGEEFTIILPETPHDAAFTFAERMRALVVERCSTTVSVGLITCMNGSASPETMLTEADKALYKAKRNGKNQTRNSIIIDKALGVIDVQEAAQVGKTA
jgi:diguanylate cyclase (GGDEF)-like protein